TATTFAPSRAKPTQAARQMPLPPPVIRATLPLKSMLPPLSLGVRRLPLPATTITVLPRHPALGAEVRGIDMRRPVDAATRQAVIDAWTEHLVLVFPDQ